MLLNKNHLTKAEKAMESPTAIITTVLILGFLFSVLIVHHSKRRKQQRIQSALRADGQAFNDGFYCIMLKDGTSRSGYIDQQTAKQP